MGEVETEPLLKSGHTLPELLAAVSAASLGVAAVYYWGFFTKLNTSLISTLTIPDFLLGALVGVVPTFVSFLLGGLIRPISDGAGITPATDPRKSRWSQLIPPEKLIVPLWIIYLPSHLATNGKGFFGFAILFFTSLVAVNIVGTAESPVVSLAAVLLVFCVGSGWVLIADAYGMSRYGIFALIILTVLGCSYSLGRADFNRRLHADANFGRDAVVLSSGTTFFGKVLLFTSTSVIIAGNSEFVQMFPLSNVSFVKSGVAE